MLKLVRFILKQFIPHLRTIERQLARQNDALEELTLILRTHWGLYEYSPEDELGEFSYALIDEQEEAIAEIKEQLSKNS